MLGMELLPKGANFVRAKILWEIGLHLAGNPATPYGGNRDMVITIGSGSSAAFRPWLRLATGSAILAEQVAKGDGMELAFVNPSALLTQAYRGVGLFSAPLPVRIVAVYPSWDRFVFMVHPRTGIRSLVDIKAKRYPLRVSVREDSTHSTLVLIDQAFALHGFALKDIESWGGRLILCGGPSDVRRLVLLCHKFVSVASSAAWATRERRCQSGHQSPSHRCNRVRNVAFRPQRRILWAGNLRVRQIAGRAWWHDLPRGESSLARRSGIRRPQCKGWRDGGSRANPVLQNVPARPPA